MALVAHSFQGFSWHQGHFGLAGNREPLEPLFESWGLASGFRVLGLRGFRALGSRIGNFKQTQGLVPGLNGESQLTEVSFPCKLKEPGPF